MRSVQFEGEAIYPSKIICVGRNYVDHIQELDNEVPEELLVFLKPNSALSNAICVHHDDEIHFESEIAFLVKSGNLAGVGFGLDLTKRAIQSRLKQKGLPWERAKAFDKSAVFSEFVSIDGSVSDIRMELAINGRLTQAAGCDLMLHKPRSILNEVKTFLTLEDGDVIMTGTPKGVGVVQKGDAFLGKIMDGERTIVEASWIVC